jgi:hypothetical protein
MTPSHGKMYWWKPKSSIGWRFGFCSHETQGLVRMGRWNGDFDGGSVVSPEDIDWKAYQ